MINLKILEFSNMSTLESEVKYWFKSNSNITIINCSSSCYVYGGITYYVYMILYNVGQ